MERIFSTFREASQEASRLCQEHGTTASLERRGGSWAVVFDGTVPNGVEAPEPNPLLLEIQDLRDQLANYRRECKFANTEVKRLSKAIDSLEKEHLLIQPLLSKGVEACFSSDVLDRMTQENSHMLRRFGYLCELDDSGKIDQSAFNDFKASSGMWVAIHNYEKIKSGPQPVHVPDHPRPVAELCSSCGGAVINGYCRCSN
jgi:hypothetical protein